MSDENHEIKAADGLLGGSHIARSFLIGITLVLAGFAIEAWLPGLIDYINSFRVAAPADAAGHAANHSLGPIGLAVLLAKEMGVAFMVAGIIGWAIERQARERDNQRAMELRRDVANDAVFAIFGLRRRRDFINAVVETNLEARIVRENMALHYRLRPLNESEAAAISAKKPDEALQRFVMLEMTSSFRFRNVASAEEAVTIGYAIAMRHGQGPRQITKASYVRIGQEEFQDAAIAEAIASSASADELRYEWVRRIAAGQTLPVFIVARCVKELSDNEVWGSFFPTMEGANLSLTVLSGMRFGVRPVTNAAMREQVGEPSEVSKSWVLTGPLLRHNSLVFWWRTPEDDGEEESSPAVEYSAPEAAKSSLAERRRWYHRLLDISRGWD